MLIELRMHDLGDKPTFLNAVRQEAIDITMASPGMATQYYAPPITPLVRRQIGRRTKKN